MLDVQAMLALLEEHGTFVSPFVRAVIDMAGSGDVMTEGDAITLLRMCARMNPQPADLGLAETPFTSNALRAA